MKTSHLRKEDLSPKWILIDCANLILGRIATRVADILKGKHKTTYSPHNLCGDFVILINCDKIVVTGKKEKQKIYYHHTGYMGGIKEINYEDAIKKDPTFAIFKAIERMLAKSAQRKRMLRRLSINVGNSHNHSAQCPSLLDISEKKYEVK